MLDVQDPVIIILTGFQPQVQNVPGVDHQSRLGAGILL